ncbi:MAG: potassium channel family protein, partial [Candidatus Kapabacteria bacterium]|nr:potassium channel family protein [Candidatus Kapabacteria bacterium]
YKDEDKSYTEFKIHENLADYNESKLKHPLPKGLIYRVFIVLRYLAKLLLFDKIGKFGTSPGRVLLTMIVTFMLFASAYYPLQEIPHFHNSMSGNSLQTGIQQHGCTLEDAAYFSAYNMLIIGYEDYHPSGITGILSVFESFIGLFLMSYFTVAFVRKVLR